MRLRREQLLLYGVTDRGWTDENHTLLWQVQQALAGGVTMLQFREKTLSHAKESLLQEAYEIKKLCQQYQVPFLINDDVALAKELDADGVHIGQEDMGVIPARQILGKEKIIGVTAKTVEQAIIAQQDGADYLGSGAVFGTSTKKDAKPMSRQVLQEICKSVSIPVVAIGGITKENISQLHGCGIAGVAVVSGIFAQKEIEDTTKQLRSEAEKIVRLK